MKIKNTVKEKEANWNEKVQHGAEMVTAFVFVFVFECKKYIAMNEKRRYKVQSLNIISCLQHSQSALCSTQQCFGTAAKRELCPAAMEVAENLQFVG